MLGLHCAVSLCRKEMVDAGQEYMVDKNAA